MNSKKDGTPHDGHVKAMANITFGIYLGRFWPEIQSFCKKKPQNHGHGTHSANMSTVVWLKIPKMSLNFLAQFVCPSPKVWDFRKKALSGCPSLEGTMESEMQKYKIWNCLRCFHLQ